SMASAKSSNSKVRSTCFFSNSHSGIFFRRSFSSGALIKSAITGQRVTPENRFATPKRARLKSEDFAQIFRRIEDFDRAVTRFARAAFPIGYQIVDCTDGSIQIADKMKAALPGEIFSRAAVFGNHRTAGC